MISKASCSNKEINDLLRKSIKCRKRELLLQIRVIDGIWYQIKKNSSLYTHIYNSKKFNKRIIEHEKFISIKNYCSDLLEKILEDSSLQINDRLSLASILRFAISRIKHTIIHLSQDMISTIVKKGYNCCPLG